MKIGLTFDLKKDYLAEGYDPEIVAEFDNPQTIDAIDGALQTMGHDTERIGHARHLLARLHQGQRWDLVFNIAEGLYGYGREALVPALLDAYKIPYVFSDPLVCALTLHKGMTKHVLRDLGLPTPAFAVVETPEDIDAIDLPYPLFVKPVAEGTSKGVLATSKCNDKDELRKQTLWALERFEQPALVETFLPGREVTVGIAGTGRDARALATMEVLLLPQAEQGIYTYKNKEDYVNRVRYQIAQGAFDQEAKALALQAWRGLGCRDGGRVDLRADDTGRLNVLEINPLPGLHPKDSDLPLMCTMAGIAYQTLLEAIVSSALRRVERRVL